MMMLFILCTLCTVLLSNSLCLDKKWASRVYPQTTTRRDVLVSRVATPTAVALLLLGNPQQSSAARGAAELDMEYYLRNLVGGNKKEGVVQASAIATAPPPRKLRDPLPSLLLNKDCTVDCLSTLALVEVAREVGPPGLGEDPRYLEKQVERMVARNRNTVADAFFRRAPWKEASIHDQYYFDVTAYSFWKTAAVLLPNFADRDRFVRRIGCFVYDNLVRYKVLHRAAVASSDDSVSWSNARVKELLDLFVSSGLIKSYRLGEGDTTGSTALFDIYDDDSIRQGASINCLISVLEPATLGASLQITGEQSRFVPSYVGSTLAALWATMGLRCQWDVYFVDPEYRSNPKDYFPTEQLYQFTLAKA